MSFSLNIKNEMPLWAARIQNISALWYLCWLLLPAVQCLTHAVTGAFSLLLFLIGVLMDGGWAKHHWRELLAEALCMLLVPLCMKIFVQRGQDFLGFYAEAVMFFFPPVFACHVLLRGDSRLLRGTKAMLISVFAVTVCTTTGWLIQGMLRGGKVYAYSRSLGYAGDADAAAYLKELMLRNIGGYDFIYAAVAALPLTFLGIWRQKGKKRAALILLCALQTAMILLSQYTYAALYAAVIIWMELAGMLLVRLFRGRLSQGKAMLIAMLPLLAAVILRKQLVGFAAQLCENFGLENFAQSFRQLMAALESGTAGENSRLFYYRMSLDSLVSLPLFGGIFGGNGQIGGHSDILDLLSGMGLIGGAAVSAMIGFTVLPLGKLIHHCEKSIRIHLRLCVACVIVTALLGTVIYSRDISAVTSFGLLLAGRGINTLPVYSSAAPEDGLRSSSQNP